MVCHIKGSEAIHNQEKRAITMNCLSMGQQYKQPLLEASIDTLS